MILTLLFLGLGSRADLASSPALCESAIQASPRLSLVAQTFNVHCGPACLVSVLRYWQGQSPNDIELGRMMGTSHEGTFAEQLVDGAKAFGLLARYQEIKKFEDLRTYVEQHETVIVLWNFNGVGHWSVVDSIAEDRIRLMDPWLARRGEYHVMSKRKFLSVWYGHNFFGLVVRISAYPTINSG